VWLSVTLIAEARCAEALSEALMEAGALSVSIEDADAGTERETPQFGEPGHVNEQLWDQSRVIALFDKGADLALALAEAASAVGLETVPDFSIEEIAEQNWVQLTQSQFEPIRIDERLWIVPSWHDAPNRDAINIEMDPGMAFGTGSHGCWQSSSPATACWIMAAALAFLALLRPNSALAACSAWI
jgi:ribosomal protein L11 methyltransferase